MKKLLLTVLVSLLLVPASQSVSEAQAEEPPSVSDFVSCVHFMSRILTVREGSCKPAEIEVKIAGEGPQGPPGPPGPMGEQGEPGPPGPGVGEDIESRLTVLETLVIGNPDTPCGCFSESLLTQEFSDGDPDCDDNTDDQGSRTISLRNVIGQRAFFLTTTSTLFPNTDIISSVDTGIQIIEDGSESATECSDDFFGAQHCVELMEEAIEQLDLTCTTE